MAKTARKAKREVRKSGKPQKAAAKKTTARKIDRPPPSYLHSVIRKPFRPD